MNFIFVDCLAAEQKDHNKWLAKDKAKHFFISFGLSVLAYNTYLKNTDLSRSQVQAAAFGTVMAVGASKEFWDTRPGGTGFSWKDMTADAAGAALGVGLRWEF